MYFPLRFKFLIMAGGVAILALGLTLWVLSYQLERQLTRQIGSQLRRAETTFTEWRRESREHLKAEARIVAVDPRFFAAVAEGDAATTIPVAHQFQHLAGSDLFLVSDQHGQRLAHLDHHGELRALNWPRSLPPIEEQLRLDDELYLVQSQAVTVGEDTLGYVGLGRQVDAGLAEAMGRIAGADVIFYDASTVFGTTFRPSRKGALMNAVRDVANHDVVYSTSIPIITLDNERYLFHGGSLQEGSDYRYGVLISLDERLKPRTSELRATLLWVGLLAVVLAVAVSMTAARRMTARVPRLVEAVEAVARGDYDHAVTHEGHDELTSVAEAVDRMRRELAAQIEQIRRANTAKLDAERLAVIGKMSSSIIHDFKTPMQVIRGAMDLSLSAELSSDKRERYATIVNHELDRMVGMTRDLLDFARGETRMARATLNVDEFLDDAVEAWRHAAKEHRVSIAFVTRANAVVSIDPDKMRRALDNIVSNAIDVLSEGGAVTVVTVTRGQELEIMITDSGPGIPNDVRDRIFEPFATFGKANGTGLGLAVAKKAIDDHGGRIRVDSAQGRGTTFTISLPMNDNTSESKPSDSQGDEGKVRYAQAVA